MDTNLKRGRLQVVVHRGMKEGTTLDMPKLLPQGYFRHFQIVKRD